jgi:hypothetical protein
MGVIALERIEHSGSRRRGRRRPGRWRARKPDLHGGEGRVFEREPFAYNRRRRWEIVFDAETGHDDQL